MSAVLARYPHSEQLLDVATFSTTVGEIVAQDRDAVAPPGASVRMFRHLEFDICELPIISYLVAREHGVPLVGLPIFVTRDFDHVKIICNTERVREPKDLEGGRVGVGYYGFTDGAWARAILAYGYGVDLDRVQWVTSAEEVVAGAQPPAGVEHRPGAALDQLLVDGELDAVILTRAGHYLRAPHVGSLFPDLPTVERRWYDETGVLPIHHMITVRAATLEARPGLPRVLMSAFTQAKEAALAALQAGRALSPEQEVKARFSGFPTARADQAERSYLGADPLPYGISANRRAIDMALKIAAEQRIVSEIPALEDRFVLVEP
jgi:4,5-dihydroxyphthalate decarboxylase